MEDNSFVTFVLSFAPAFIFLSLIFLGQGRNLVSTDFKGILTIVLCSLFTIKIAIFLNMRMINQTSLSMKSLDMDVLFYTNFFGIGMNEEGAKIIPILILLFLSPRWRNKQDIYFACICIGAFFAAIENLVSPHYNDYHGLLLLRSLTAVPAHLSLACLMAPFLCQATKKKDFSKKSNIYISVMFLILELFALVAFFYWANDNPNLKNNSGMRTMQILIYIGIGLLFFIHLYAKLNSAKRREWLSVFYDIGFILLAILLPAALHGFYDFMQMATYGVHKQLADYCFFATFMVIMIHTYLYLKEIPNKEKVILNEEDYFQKISEVNK